MLDHDDNSAFGTSNYSHNSMLNDPAPEQQPTAVIGSKIRFKGELVGEEDLVVQGTVDGTIDLKGHNLIVGQQGTLNANVSAKTITVEGKVEGDMYGEEKITIKESSDVKGNVVAARVSLEDGAKFKGSIDMDVEAATAKPAKTDTAKTDTLASLDTHHKKGDGNSNKSSAKLQ